VLLFSVATSKLEKTNVPTTTIRLPEDLKQRVSRAAERAGTSSHAFILAAIAERVAAAERRDDFYDTAERRYAEIAESGETIPWNKMRTYLADRIAGKQSARPKARKLGR
jgi:predicted transcriptional regulator